MSSKAPPLIDFSPFYDPSSPLRPTLIAQLRDACLTHGFFQLTSHRVPTSLQSSLFTQSRAFFSLPLSSKLTLDKRANHYNRGYEVFGSQIFEPSLRPDTKEGFLLGRHLDESHPLVQQKKFSCGPNLYPGEEVGWSKEQVKEFKEVMEAYSEAVYALARDVTRALALTLGLEESVFDAFNVDSVITLKLLRYPPTPKGDGLDRGIGAHRDFGAVTLLLQDEVGGLQVWDKETDTWHDVPPVPGAYVVNLGNMMRYWTGNQYQSNMHRVINNSEKERFSVPFFFNGSPNSVVKLLPGCVPTEDWVEEPAAITVGEYIDREYKRTYGAADKYRKMAEEREKTKDEGKE